MLLKLTRKKIMEKVFTKNEFDKKIKSILLSKDYVDYNYYAVYIAKHIELYFENPFDKNYYNIKDIKTVLGEKINPNHDIYMDLVYEEFKELKSSKTEKETYNEMFL